MSLDAGKLRHRLVLQRPVVSLDSDGAQTHAWEEVATVWGAIEPISGREFVQSAAVQSQVTVRITLRWRPDLRADWRISHAAKPYQIAAVLPDKDSGLEYITCPCSEGPSDGR